MGRKSNKATTQNKTDTGNDKLRVQPLPITEVCDMKTGKAELQHHLHVQD